MNPKGPALLSEYLVMNDKYANCVRSNVRKSYCICRPMGHFKGFSRAKTPDPSPSHTIGDLEQHFSTAMKDAFNWQGRCNETWPPCRAGEDEALCKKNRHSGSRAECGEIGRLYF